jgi:hypothetical protein
LLLTESGGRPWEEVVSSQRDFIDFWCIVSSIDSISASRNHFYGFPSLSSLPPSVFFAEVTSELMRMETTLNAVLGRRLLLQIETEGSTF